MCWDPHEDLQLEVIPYLTLLNHESSSSSRGATAGSYGQKTQWHENSDQKLTTTPELGKGEIEALNHCTPTVQGPNDETQRRSTHKWINTYHFLSGIAQLETAEETPKVLLQCEERERELSILI